MKLNTLLVSLLILVSLGCSKQQKIIYEVQSVSFKRGNSIMSSRIQTECNSISDRLSSHLDSGWRVVTSSPKEKMVAYDTGACVGTEYILEKSVPPAIFTKIFSKTDTTLPNSSTKSSSKPSSPADVEIPANSGLQGTVTQVLNSGGYIYMEVVLAKGNKVWLATPETTVAVGDKIEYPDTPFLSNFESKALMRTFDKISFITGIRVVK